MESFLVFMGTQPGQSIRRLAYVVPKFPLRSGVFEQNEVAGILENDVETAVVACRRPSRAELGRVHDFARRLLDVTIYPRLQQLASGAARALRTQPRTLVGCIGLLWRCLIGNPRGFPKEVAAFVVAVSAFGRLSAKRQDWVHADFGSSAATAGMFLARLLKCPFSYKVHAFEVFDKRFVRQDALAETKFSEARLVFSEHAHGRDRLVELFGCESSRVVINYSSVRTSDFRYLGSPRESSLFVALGRLVPKKGFHVLVEAAARLKESGEQLQVEIHGYGPGATALEERIRALGVEDVVRLMGPYDNDRLPEILRDALAVVVPSVRTPTGDMDGVPTVIYEAMALGRAVVGTRLSGIPEIVRHGENGLLVSPGSVEGLASALAMLLRDNETAADLGRRGRDYVERYHDNVRLAAELLQAMEGSMRGTAEGAQVRVTESGECASGGSDG